MNIQFESLKLTNFLSLGSVQVDLQERGFVLVEGINKNVIDNAKSNGSGKSSLFEGIVWILTGDTIRGTKDVVNKLAHNGGACGELDFSIDSNKYKIIRFRDDLSYGNMLKVYYNGEDVSGKGIRDSSKILEQYLPEISAQLLGSVIVLGQGLPQRFTNNTPSGRKEILEQLSKSDYMIEDIKNKLSFRRININTDLRYVKDDTIRISTNISTNDILISNRKESIANAPSSSELLALIDEFKLKHVQFQTNIDNLSCELAHSKEKETKLLQEYNTKSIEIRDKYEQLLYTNKDAISSINLKINEVKYKSNDLSSKISNAKNVQTECPYCHRSYDDIHKPDTREWEQEQIVLNEELNKYNLDKRNLDKVSEDIVASKNSELQQIENIRIESSQVHNDSIKKEIELNQLKNKFSMSQNDLKVFEKQYAEQQAQLTIWTNDIAQAEKVNTDLNIKLLENNNKQVDLEARLESLNKLINIASKDFRTYLLESVITYIENRVKHYSTRLFNSDRAEFKNDGNQIYIGYDGKQYENLSGGEKQKLDIIVQFALRDMLIKILNFSCNMLVLDEVFDNLDEVGCENLIELITTELKDIESVYIITHHADISVPYDDRIVIVKNEDGISNIE